MYLLVGVTSGNVYATGNSKADCFRKLQEKHPSYARKEDSDRDYSVGRLYPEALKFTRKNRKENIDGDI